MVPLYDWLLELDKHRKPEQKKYTEKEKAPMIEFIKIAREDNGIGVVSFGKLSDLIEKRFGHKVSRSTIADWIK